jgi:3,4-dihydroxy 2-butanone 4-phosphate synthase/GTP cyclohydrolase II
VLETVPIITTPNPFNSRYLKTKEEKLGHTLKLTKTNPESRD